MLEAICASQHDSAQHPHAIERRVPAKVRFKLSPRSHRGRKNSSSPRFSRLALHALDARGLQLQAMQDTITWSPPNAPVQLLAAALSAPQGIFHTWNPQSLVVHTHRPNCGISATSGTVSALAWHGCGSQLVVGSQAGNLTLYDVNWEGCVTHVQCNTWQRTASVEAADHTVTAVSWAAPDIRDYRSSSTAVLASGTRRGHIQLSDFRISNGSCSGTTVVGATERDCHVGEITCLKWDPTRSHRLAAADSSGRLVFWDARRTDRPVAVFPARKTGHVRSLNWSTIGSGLLAYATGLAGSSDQYNSDEIRLVQVNSLEEEAFRFEHISTGMAVDKVIWCNASARLIACQSLLPAAPLSRSSATSVSTSYSDGVLRSLNESKPQHPIVTYAYPRMREETRLDGHIKPIVHAAVSAKDNLLATGGLEQILKVWELPRQRSFPSRNRGHWAPHAVRHGSNASHMIR